MHLGLLRASGVRNLIDFEARLDRVNVIHGRNGSGKTSLLEAVSLLGTGRSFRSHHVDTVIRHGELACTVYGLFQDPEDKLPDLALGVRRPRSGQLEARVRGESVSSAARLAEQLPLQTINSSSFDLLESGPGTRRRFLDWGVFHVEHRFHDTWLSVQRTLKQRNSLLRHGKIIASELNAWDQRLASAGESLDLLRHTWFQRYEATFQKRLAALDVSFGIELHYIRGWGREVDLLTALERSREADRKRGFTGPGPQRADIRIRVAGVNAADVLSRGQQKLVVIAMSLAQGELLESSTGRRALYLVDDLPAELDAPNRRRLCEALVRIQCQLLITCVDPGDLADCWDELAPQRPAMFHVEHGRIKRTN